MQTNFQFDLYKKIGLNKLQCVECKSSLRLTKNTVLTCKSGHTYKIINNIPLLLPRKAKRYLNEVNKSDYGRSMKDEYFLSKSTILKKIIKKISTIPNIVIRMYDIQKVFDKVSFNENTDAFVVSIGGGPIRDRKNIINLNIDLYPNVEIVGDAHTLPFKNNSIDGVVINAVLEHLADPKIAVKEIYRVLRKGGYVFAETPFLQHYHGYPFHFQNFTLTGHNFLFKDFKQLQSGAVTGPFSTVATFILNVPEDLITNKYIRKIVLYLLAIFLLPLRLLDFFLKNNVNTYKLTSGVYLLAQKR